MSNVTFELYPRSEWDNGYTRGRMEIAFQSPDGAEGRYHYRLGVITVVHGCQPDLPTYSTFIPESDGVSQINLSREQLEQIAKRMKEMEGEE